MPVAGGAAFSLIELLAVMALLLILTSMYWGSNSGRRQRETRAACQNNLQKIFVAMEIFANDHSGRFPQAAGARTSEEALDPLVPRYTSDTAAFICPGTRQPPLPPGESFLQRKISYAYWMGLGRDAPGPLMSDRLVDTQPKAVGAAVFSTTGQPPGDNHGARGGNFMFCDGHVERSPAQTPFAVVLNSGVVLLNPK